MRRLRKAPWMRNLVAEHELLVQHLIQPVFVLDAASGSEPVPAMPGVQRLGLAELLEFAKECSGLGIPALALFPWIDQNLRDPHGSYALKPDGIIPRAVALLKSEVPDIGVIADIALDPYTSHGQDGILAADDRSIANDVTLEQLAKQAVVLAEAGVDIVAPSDMMDGRIARIREELLTSHPDVVILSYAAKYASALYGPFRQAVGSDATLGKADKRTYQMDPRSRSEAFREIALDIEEGADMVMIKPAGSYLDVVARAADSFDVPILAYQVSGEYSMLKRAVLEGQLSAEAPIEVLTGFVRAGAVAVFSYFASEVAAELNR